MLGSVSPLEIGRLLEALNSDFSEGIGHQAVIQLAAAKGFNGLRYDQLEPWVTRFPATIQTEAEPLLQRLNQDAAKQRERLDQIAGELPKGDIRQGQSIFNS